MSNGVSPDPDKPLEGKVGDKFLGVEHLHGGGAGVVAVVEPALDARTIVGDSGAEADGGFHDVERYWAPEEAWNRDAQIISHHSDNGRLDREEPRENQGNRRRRGRPCTKRRRQGKRTGGRCGWRVGVRSDLKQERDWRERERKVSQRYCDVTPTPFGLFYSDPLIVN